MNNHTKQIVTRIANDHHVQVVNSPLGVIYVCIPFTQKGTKGHDLVKISTIKQLYIALGY